MLFGAPPCSVSKCPVRACRCCSRFRWGCSLCCVVVGVLLLLCFRCRVWLAVVGWLCGGVRRGGRRLVWFGLFGGLGGRGGSRGGCRRGLGFWCLVLPLRSLVFLWGRLRGWLAGLVGCRLRPVFGVEFACLFGGFFLTRLRRYNATIKKKLGGFAIAPRGKAAPLRKRKRKKT